MKVERLIVDVQMYGPMVINGLSGVSGGTTTVGRVSPREDAVTFDEPDTVGLREGLAAFGMPCRALSNGDIETEGVDDVVCLEALLLVEVAEEFRLCVDEGKVSEIELGMAAGQKDHILLAWSQNKSISNLWKPTANRLEKHSPELSSSYL